MMKMLFPMTKEPPKKELHKRNEELAGLQTLIQEREEAMPLRERIKAIFKKYGVTVTSHLSGRGRHDSCGYWYNYQRFEKTRNRIGKWA